MSTVVAEYIEFLGGEFSLSSLDRVKIQPGGSTSWVFPDATGESLKPELRGVILAASATRSYRPSGFDAESDPECTSPDGILGYGTPGGSCRACPYAQWGSAEGSRGQACRRREELVVLIENEALPVVVSIPPTSASSFQSYIRRLGRGRTPVWGVLTSLKLEAKAIGSYKVAVAAFSKVRDLDFDEQQEHRRVSEIIGGALSKRQASAENLVDANERDIAEQAASMSSTGRSFKELLLEDLGGKAADPFTEE